MKRLGIITSLVAFVLCFFVATDHLSAQTAGATNATSTSVSDAAASKKIQDDLAAAFIKSQNDVLLANTNIPPQGTFDYFQSIVSGLNQATIEAIDGVTARYNGTPAFNQQQTISNNFKALVTTSYEAYVSAFNAEKTRTAPGDPKGPSNAQIAGIRAWSAVVNTARVNGRPTLNSVNQSAPQRTAYITLSLAMDQLAQNALRINRGTLSASSLEAVVQTPAASTIINATAGNRNDAKEKPPVAETCSFLPMNLYACLNEGVSWLIKNTLLQIAGFLVWVSANMFNYSVQIGVLSFATWAPDSLYPIWIIIRQIISLIVVFAGIFLGCKFILDSNSVEFARYMPWVVAFALFVNFSYPLVRTAVDVSNIISLNIYASIVGEKALDPTYTGSNTAGALIMNRLGLQGLVMAATDTGDDKNSAFIGKLNSIPASLLVVAFVLYAAYIFLMLTGIIIFRTAALVFLIIVSPLLLVDSVIPMLGERAKKLRQVLFEQLIVAPVFMIMLALTLKFLEVFSKGPMASVSSGANTTITTFFNILLMLIMLHIMLKVVKEVSGTLGQYATNAMGMVGGLGLGVATGALGFAGRKSLGLAATKVRDSSWMTKNQDTFMGRRALNLSNSVSKSSFDLRNSKVVAGGMSKAGLGAGVLGYGGMGSGSTSSADKETKESTDEMKARLSRIPTHYERDTMVNGKLKRKGEEIEGSKEARAQFFNDNNNSIFRTQKQKDELNDAFVDSDSESSMKDYAKKKNRADKETYRQALETERDTLLKTDPKQESPRMKSLLRSIHDIGKEEEKFEEQVTAAIDTYGKLDEVKRNNYLANLNKELRDSVEKKLNSTGAKPTAEPTAQAAPSATTTASPTTAQAAQDKIDWEKVTLEPMEKKEEKIDWEKVTLEPMDQKPSEPYNIEHLEHKPFGPRKAKVLETA